MIKKNKDNQSVAYRLATLLLVVCFIIGGCGGGSAGTGTGDSTLRIQGTVRDPSGVPVDAATVTVIETGDSDLTNPQGEFVISTTRVEGDITLEFSKDNRAATTTVTAPGENGTLSIDVKFDDVREVVETEELSVEASIVGSCDPYFENFHTIRQANPVSPGTQCVLKVKVAAGGQPVPHVPIAVQFGGCSKGASFTAVALGATMSGGNIGVAQIPFAFFDDKAHCLYRVVTPYGEEGIKPVISEIHTLTYQHSTSDK